MTAHNIDFNAERWRRVKDASRRWWAGTLERPLLCVTLNGRDPGRPEPAVPAHGFTAFYGASVSAEQIVDRWTYTLESQRFLGDAFPAVWPNFGAGVMAAFLGATAYNGETTVWFHPPRHQEIADISLKYDAGSPALARIKDICRAAMQRWQGLVQCGMTDLGGNLDVVSSFRPSEQLLFDLYDHPEHVKRLTWQVHDLWQRYFDEINRVLQPVNPGYTAWTAIYSEQPYYMLQCDFCYMIGPAMFDEFVKPELAAMCKRLVNPFYHLDGPGQLPHLDSLLAIKELKGVQWIHGDGQPTAECWPEVYRKIRAAGKLVQVFGRGDWATTARMFDTIVAQVGDARGIVLIAGADAKDERDVMKFLEKYGAA